MPSGRFASGYLERADTTAYGIKVQKLEFKAFDTFVNEFFVLCLNGFAYGLRIIGIDAEHGHHPNRFFPERFEKARCDFAVIEIPRDVAVDAYDARNLPVRRDAGFVIPDVEFGHPLFIRAVEYFKCHGSYGKQFAHTQVLHAELIFMVLKTKSFS